MAVVSTPEGHFRCSLHPRRTLFPQQPHHLENTDRAHLWFSPHKSDSSENLAFSSLVVRKLTTSTTQPRNHLAFPRSPFPSTGLFSTAVRVIPEKHQRLMSLSSQSPRAFLLPAKPRNLQWPVSTTSGFAYQVPSATSISSGPASFHCCDKMS